MPIQIEPTPCESLPGYLLRLSSLNHLRHLGRLFDPPIIDNFESALLNIDENVIANLTRLPLDALASTTWPLRRIKGAYRLKICDFYGHHIQGRFHDWSRPKVCPQCLAERPIIPSEWDLVFWVACPVHKSSLISNCQVCRRRLTWLRPGLMQCACGASLATQSAPEVSAPVLPLVRFIGAKFSSIFDTSADERYQSPLQDLLGHLTLSDLLVLIGFLGGIAPRGVSTLGERRVSHSRSSDQLEAVTQAAKVLAAWPHEFHRLIGLSRNPEYKRQAPGHVLVPMRRVLWHTIPGPQFEFLRHEFRVFIDVNYKRHGMRLPAVPGFLRARKAARELGLSDFRNIFQLVPDHLTTHPYFQNLIEIHSIEHLMHQLQSMAVTLGNEVNADQWENLGCRPGGSQPLRLGPLIKSVLRGQIAVGQTTDGKGLRRFYILRSDVALLDKARQSVPQAKISRGEAAEILGCTKSHVSTLTSNGFFGTLPLDPESKRGTRLLRREQVVTFHNKYVLSRELAEVLRAPVRRVPSILKRLGLRPARFGKRCSSVAWDRSEAEAAVRALSKHLAA